MAYIDADHETSTHRVILTPNVKNNPLMPHIPDVTTVQQSHHQEVKFLPYDAFICATNPHTSIQAFFKTFHMGPSIPPWIIPGNHAQLH